VIVLLIKGLEKLSLIDYPDKTCAIIFVAGCNFRCPYCQNPNLINHEELPEIDEKKLLSWLKKRKKWLDAVCITGGEPTLYNDLPEFLKKIKQIGFLIKVDTNGTNPEMLRRLIDDSVLDYIAMDIKAPLEKYKDVVNSDVDLNKIQKSVDIIRDSKIEYEFRTTIVPGLLSAGDVLTICNWLKGSKRFYIQQFRPVTTLDKKYESVSPYTQEELETFGKMAKPFFTICGVRDN
jgi:pyruvate formate lyase activating enzyme